MIDTSKFWVVAVISNPQRFKNRRDLFLKFRDYVLSKTPNDNWSRHDVCMAECHRTCTALIHINDILRDKI